MSAGHARVVAATVMIVLCGLAFARCTSRASSAPPVLEPVVSVEELMESIIDPLADNIFDAVATDITDKGVVDIRPTTDEDWAKVRHGAVTLAESTNLLKIPRPVAPPGDKNNSDGPNPPELSPEQIQAKIDQDRALWDKLAEEMRVEAIKVLDIVKAKDVDALFQAGSDLDRACENCHLEYWYPGDKKAVLEDEKKRATITPPKK